jgi:hypothetical protein
LWELYIIVVTEKTMNFDICHKNEFNSVLKEYYAGARKYGAVIDLTSDR